MYNYLKYKQKYVTFKKHIESDISNESYNYFMEWLGETGQTIPDHIYDKRKCI
jgi:hypothetical protein